ncbi:MAG: AIR synthase-related protein [Desulfosarcinaceae bacterium]|nr:AIR synthase-related protein [Desulfosarcinaceae bacterium]
MPYRIEIALRSGLPDAEGRSISQKAADYFGITVDAIRTIHILTLDADLNESQVVEIQRDIFTNPVTQVSSLEPLEFDFDWCIWVGFRPGVRDTAGSTGQEAIEDLLGYQFGPQEGLYTSKRYCLKGEGLTRVQLDRLASELLANDIIQRWQIFSSAEWRPTEGVGYPLSKVRLDHEPQVTTLAIDSDASLQALSDARNLALNPNDIPVIRRYFLDPKVQAERAAVGLGDPTDLELEYISQARSDHCNHNTFRGRFDYRDLATGEREEIVSLFKTCIQTPTLDLQKRKPWVKSVLWDNAGVGEFDDDHLYVITGETHNSPSNMEAYGGAITGIVGIYRDPMGTGRGSKLIMGSYGYCVGPRDYDGELQPRLHPRRLLDGVIEGVRDGGNKSGIPTPFGQVLFHPGYLGKCLVFVTALGIMPAMIKGEPAHEKTILPGDRVVMCGGRVGKDGIHGVTASSEVFSADTPAGHVQIGDPYTQKKMHDFLLEARDEGLTRFITDNGGGGLSSSVGETAMFSKGVEVDLEKVPLKYDGLDQWEIWISESQERMTVAVPPEHVDRFMELSRRHAVESTVIGTYNDSGKLHIKYNNDTCAHVDLDFLESGFPRWQFDAHWTPPDLRGLVEPVIKTPSVYNTLLLDLLARPNIASKEWVARQYDHEVQGTSVIKPLVGRQRDLPSDAAVIRPVLTSQRGLVFAQALLPWYSAVDAYHMAACTIDEALRRHISVGGDPEHVGGVDNFCWPNIQYHPVENPDGRFKAAQLVRACKALKEICLAYGIPLLSGKDSMYVDGHLPGAYGESHKVSAPETLQFSTTGVIEDIDRCVTMEPKRKGDALYLLGTTRDELGGSEYYDRFGYVGLQVPTVRPDEHLPLYQALTKAIAMGLCASVHGIYRGGLGVHLALMAMGADLGLVVELARVPGEGSPSDATLLFSESAGRFLVTVGPDQKAAFEDVMGTLAFACIGDVTDGTDLVVRGRTGAELISLKLHALRDSWKTPFGHLL